MSNNTVLNAIQFFDQVFDTVWDSGTITTTGGTGWPVGSKPYGQDVYYTIPTNVKIYNETFPPLNVWVHQETKDLLLEFAVAGIPKENITVDFEGDRMVLEIESVSSDREDYVLSQKGIRTSKSRTTYVVPQSKYDVTEARAELKDGILSISIPAREDQRPRRLTID